jgi:hypothetical protein
MSETTWIVLIVTAAVIVVLWMFRGTLSRFFLRANRDGVEAELQTRESEGTPSAPSPAPGVNISGNRQLGKDNEIAVGRDNVNVSDNLQAGEEQSIDVKADKKK